MQTVRPWDVMLREIALWQLRPGDPLSPLPNHQDAAGGRSYSSNTLQWRNQSEGNSVGAGDRIPRLNA